MKSIRFFSLLLLLVSFHAFGQQKTDDRILVNGVVRDRYGEPLIGATIIAQNQPGLGTTTGVDGSFSFRCRETDILVFSYIGFDPLELPVLKIQDRDNLQVILDESTQEIEEVVITAAGAQKKQTVTGAFTTVDVSQLNTPTPNLTNSLAGVVPGIIAVQTSGEPGENVSEFWIRGVSTFGAKSGALVLVDGIERSFNEIPVEDIETFSVLKDASATAIYGQRGANGVILVTTKKGEKGKVKINTKYTFGINRLTKYPEYTDVYTYATMANEALTGRYQSPLYSEAEMRIIENGLDPDLYPNVNWRDLLLKSQAPNVSANMNISGGGDFVTYYVSLGYYNEDGIYKSSSRENKYNTNTTYERFNYRTNINLNLTNTTVVKVGIGGWLVNRNAPGSQSTDIWGSFANYTPLTFPRRYSSGEWPARTPEVLMTQTGYRRIWQNKMETNIGVEQNLNFITPGLNFYGVFAFDTDNRNTIIRSKLPEIWVAQNYRDQDGSLILRRINNEELMTQTSATEGNKRYYLQAQLDYSRLLLENHRVGVFAMAYLQEVMNTNLGEDIIASIPKKNLAYSGRFTYSLFDRYLAEFNWGYTGSENFEKGKQFGFFPAFSAGWVISEEPFVKELAPWLNYFKVRGSYGEVGNDEIAGQRFPYVTLITESESGRYTFGEFGSNSIPGYRITRLGTPYLTWEVAKKYDLGFDFTFWDNKITGAFDIFKDKRNDIFMQRNYMPLTTGLQDQVPMANVGKMQSNGFDGNIAFSEKIDKVNFTLRGNITYQNSEVLDKDEAANELWYKMEKGFRQDQTRGLIALGLFKDEADIASSPRQDFGGRDVLPGDIKYKDVNGDGVINDDDIVPLGYRTVPGLQYGMGVSVNWNNFDLSVLFQGAGKRDFFVNGPGVFPFANSSQGNILQLMADGKRWISREVSGNIATEDHTADWPRLTYGNNENNNRNSTFWLKNGRYVRLKNVEFSYTVPQSVLRQFHVSSLRIGFIGQNLFTWSPFKWWDPESGQSSGSNYPITKNYSLYLQLNF